MIKLMERERINETYLIQIIKIEQNLTTFKNHVLTSGVAEAMKVYLRQAVNTKIFSLEAIFILQSAKQRKKNIQKWLGHVQIPIRPKWLHRPCNYAALIFSRSNLYIHAPRLVPGKISFELPPLCQTSLCLSLINQLVST